MERNINTDSWYIDDNGEWKLHKDRIDIRPMIGASNQWEVYNKLTGKGLIGYTEKGMCRAWIDCDGDISF